MGFFSKAWKSVKKAVKSVAKSVKKVGSKIWSGVKNVIGTVGEAFGKLGPIGTIALSFVMPGIGSMLAGAWSTAAASLAGGQFGQVLAYVGQGMQTAANLASQAKGFVLDKMAPITSKLRSATEFVGGKITEGANYIVKGAQEALGVKNPASIQDMGKWVTDKAQSMFKGQATPEPTTGIQKVVSADTKLKDYVVDPSIYNPQSKAGIGELIGAPENFPGTNFPKPMGAQSFAVQADAAAKTGTSLVDIEAARQYGVDIAGKDIKAIQEKGLTPSGVGRVEAPTAGTGESLLKRIARAGSAALGGDAASGGMGYQPYRADEIPDATMSQRFGVGGYGSAGGEFLSDAQRQQQAFLAQILGQVG